MRPSGNNVNFSRSKAPCPPPPPAPPLPPVMSTGAFPGAPPIPPLNSMKIPPPPPMPNLSESSDKPVDGNSHPVGGMAALLEDIKSGHKLNHVDLDSLSSKSSNEGRDALLDDIKRGVKLRPVQTEDRSRIVHEAPPAGGIVGALMKALEERQRAFTYRGDSDDEEWDDGEE